MIIIISLITGLEVPTTSEQELLDKLWEIGHSPIKIDVLKKYLSQYDNKEDAVLLEFGFTQGFRLQYTGPRLPIMSKNLTSAEIHKVETKAKLDKEIKMGRVLGPFKSSPIPNLRVSPIGLVQKSDNGWRLITHLSYPEGNSVNFYIDPELCKVHYTSFDEVVSMIASLGESALIAKADISNAFRLLPVNPADFDLLGICFDNHIYIDKALPQGCALSCALFTKFSNFLHWVVEMKTGISTLDHYLDDYIFGGSANTNNCSILLDTFFEVSKELGVPIADNKTVRPTTILVFLGLEINTILMKVKIPKDKLSKLQELIVSMLNRNKVQLKILESMIGLMSFCARAIPSARAFLRRLYDFLAYMKLKVHKPYHLVKITSDVRSDVLVWLEFLQNFNGDCYIPDNLWLDSDTIHLYTDASGNKNLGCAAYFAGKFTQFRWPLSFAGSSIMRDITLLELIPIILALLTWPRQFENKKLMLKIDNQSLVNIVNMRTSKSKSVMKLIRPLVLLTMCNNTQFRAFHLPGAKNQISDSLSRFQMNRFRALAPNAEQHPEQIPMKFLELVSSLV